MGKGEHRQVMQNGGLHRGNAAMGEVNVSK